MKINVVELKLNKEYDLEIPEDIEYVYGVETATPILCKLIGSGNVEYAAVLCLDSTNKVINISKVAMGSIENVKVSLAQIMKTVLLSNSTQFIIAHNHPSGVLEITNNDIDMTKKIGSVASLFDIKLLDSLVVNSENALSIRERAGEKHE